MLRALFRQALLFAALASPVIAQPDLRGHGGPVRALSVAPGGAHAISGSFDSSAILWALDRGRALAILRAHDGSVNAVLALPGGRFVTGGEDGRIAHWRSGDDKPVRVARVHDGPVSGLAASAGGDLIASSSWDGTARVEAAANGRELLRLKGHKDNVNAVAFLSDGRIATAGYDATLRIWPAAGGDPQIMEFDAPLNTLATLPGDRLAAGAADGSVRLLNADGSIAARIEATKTPVIALAGSPDGGMLAAASPRGAVALIDVAGLRVRQTLTGPGLPVWSLAFSPDGKTLYSGGGDRLVRRWNPATGEHIGAVVAERPADDFAALPEAARANARGIEVFGACSVCHTLRPDDENRAGPTLHGVFGRKAGTAPGYNYSDAFRKLDLTWTPETVSRLFEIGPQAYTPGTKMPEQRVTSAEDRAALIEFLKAATAP
ncbi:MAG: c-type cytochrome [Beijerinckiaceae bacterium]